MLIVFVWFRISVAPTVLIAPFGVLALIALGLMIGIVLAPAGVLYQDIGRGLTIITTLWFFLTPVVYPPPTTWPASLLAQLNPVSPLLITTRELLTTGAVSQPANFVLVTGMALVLMLPGWVLYRVAMPHLIERMGA
jgi:lipopolysaccharide transport system permease protein